jgi:hypothetical protein
MQARYRARRTFDGSAIGRRERDGRAMKTILDARGDDADDSLVPALVIETESGRQFASYRDFERAFDEFERRFAHRLLDLATLAIERIELLGDGGAAIRCVAQQAFDTEAMSASRRRR